MQRKAMQNELDILIGEYKDCGMAREFAGTKTFEQAIKCRYINDSGREVYCGHQWCIRRTALDEIFEALSNNKEDIDKAADFEKLYNIVESQNISYIGPLTRYDIAMRIGYLKQTKVLPEKLVYLHAGALKGAKALYQLGLIEQRPSRTMKVSDFNCLEGLKELNREEHGIPNFSTYAMIVEDFLCVKHEELEKLAAK